MLGKKLRHELGIFNAHFRLVNPNNRLKEVTKLLVIPVSVRIRESIQKIFLFNLVTGIKQKEKENRVIFSFNQFAAEFLEDEFQSL